MEFNRPNDMPVIDIQAATPIVTLTNITQITTQGGMTVSDWVNLLASVASLVGILIVAIGIWRRKGIKTWWKDKVGKRQLKHPEEKYPQV